MPSAAQQQHYPSGGRASASPSVRAPSALLPGAYTALGDEAAQATQQQHHQQQQHQQQQWPSSQQQQQRQHRHHHQQPHPHQPHTGLRSVTRTPDAARQKRWRARATTAFAGLAACACVLALLQHPLGRLPGIQDEQQQQRQQGADEPSPSSVLSAPPPFAVFGRAAVSPARALRDYDPSQHRAF
jgi:hypothetical protein